MLFVLGADVYMYSVHLQGTCCSFLEQMSICIVYTYKAQSYINEACSYNAIYVLTRLYSFVIIQYMHIWLFNTSVYATRSSNVYKQASAEKKFSWWFTCFENNDS